MTAPYIARVRRADREVEVQGPTETFVRELLAELIEEHLVTGAAGGPAGSDPAQAAGGDTGTDQRAFRELLQAASEASAAEKVLLAGYALWQRGTPSFSNADLTQVFDEAMERPLNFPREIKVAARRGFVMRAPGEANRYRLTNAGLAHVRELAGPVEAT